ncbi:MAG: 50S ribosomal protein L22 [Candidatus Portnoybacteria bacterium]|nr:50S ribosomal protein L22 [Candidatus Portnoybacteria bacterium]
MQVKASLNNLRISARKARLVADMIRGMDAGQAQARLRFVSKRSADPILRLLNSALGNAKNNFNLDEKNLFISKLTVDSGTSLKRWMPRAMGRATPILKRTAHINLILDEKIPGKTILKKQKNRPSVKAEIKEKSEIIPASHEESITAVNETREPQAKPARPYDASSRAKKKFFSRQTMGNIKKVFRRKSV